MCCIEMLAGYCMGMIVGYCMGMLAGLHGDDYTAWECLQDCMGMIILHGNTCRTLHGDDCRILHGNACRILVWYDQSSCFYIHL